MKILVAPLNWGRMTIEKIDQMRENYIKEQTGLSRYDTRHYQLVLSMDELTEDAAVDVIMEYIRSTFAAANNK